jgi:cell division transport system permease protein
MKFRPGTILTLISLTITLFLIGFYLILATHLNKLEDLVNEKTPFVLELKDSLVQQDILVLEQLLQSRPYLIASSYEYIPKEKGLKLLEKEFGQQILSDTTNNPLNDVIRFNLQSDFITSGKVNGLIGELLKMPQVRYAYFEEQQVSSLKSNLKNLNLILLISGLIFIGISIVLIYNNLKLILRSDRQMLKTMELVGASPGFIKLPYIKKSIQIGLLAGSINFVVYIVLFIYLNWQMDIFAQFFDLSITIFILIFLIFAGLFFPLVFSNVLINRYIKMSESKRFL